MREPEIFRSFGPRSDCSRSNGQSPDGAGHGERISSSPQSMGLDRAARKECRAFGGSRERVESAAALRWRWRSIPPRADIDPDTSRDSMRWSRPFVQDGHDPQARREDWPTPWAASQAGFFRGTRARKDFYWFIR